MRQLYPPSKEPNADEDACVGIPISFVLAGAGAQVHSHAMQYAYQSLEPTAGRRDAHTYFIKQLPEFATLADASGGSARFR